MFNKMFGKYIWFNKELKKKYQTLNYIVYGVIALAVGLFFVFAPSSRYICLLVILAGAIIAVKATSYKNKDKALKIATLIKLKEQQAAQNVAEQTKQ